MGDIDNGMAVLQRLSEMGLTISSDDDGTGYSSLSYLKKLPRNTIKIDKSFVLEMARNDNDAVIVRSTIDLAHNLGYQVVAEGVEDEETYDLLAILGCDSIQGNYISRPVAVAGFERWLRDSPWAVAGRS